MLFMAPLFVPGNECSHLVQRLGDRQAAFGWASATPDPFTRATR